MNIIKSFTASIDDVCGATCTRTRPRASRAHAASPPPLTLPVSAATMSQPIADDEWETQTTRKQRKKQQKEKQAVESAAAAESTASASASGSASASSSSAAASSAPVAASDSSFPIGEGDESSMEADFMEAGFIGLDGQQIPKGAPVYLPPQPTTAPPPRKQRFPFDPNQLPKCFVCQVRHEMGECRKRDRL